MADESCIQKSNRVGNEQASFVRSYSERVIKARNRILTPIEICVERIRAEMHALEQYKDQPAIIQRARIFETYLKEKTRYILEDELIVGNITSKVRGASISGDTSYTVDRELDDPQKDYELRPHERYIVAPEARKELRETILPYFRGKTLVDYILNKADAEVLEKAYPRTSSCAHIPIVADMTADRDIQHLLLNYDKILKIGLNGIRKEVETYLAELDQPYSHYGLQEKREFYQAVLISLDAAMAYAQSYADLALEMDQKETNPKRRKELERIAANCEQVPANPARDWWEALQSVWMMNVLAHIQSNYYGHTPGRFDQYTYHFYKKSVIEDNTMTREQAAELLQCLWIKFNEWAAYNNYANATFAPGQALSQTITIGGQTRDGKDACNEVTLLCLEVEEQIGLPQPEFAMRIWEGTPDKYLKKAAEVIRLGYGMPKFVGDRKAIQMTARMYPDLTVEDWRDCVMTGCTEIVLPHITMAQVDGALCISAKILELTLNNGKCTICGKQIGPSTGDPRQFESMSDLQKAFREQLFYWVKLMAKGAKVIAEAKAEKKMAPFGSAMLEGPLQRGRDMAKGGASYNGYGVFFCGLANTADSLAVIDRLIYRDKKMTWDQLLDALNTNWEGREDLRQLCVNKAPKYGNDDDFADGWAAWVVNTWCDSLDWVNNQKELLPYYGGAYLPAGMIGQANVTFGHWVGALPDGRQYPKPLADCISPNAGVDKNGTSAVLNSVSKLPSHRLVFGGPLNIRLSYDMLSTDEALDRFAAFLKSFEELGIYHLQLNVISSDLLRKAMKEPQNYRDVLVRVASYCSYFVELTEAQQLDIIARTEHQGY
jgi:pyruvate formate-lyase/glycerol dehydratase family glycyl radical enzyme